MKLTPALLGVLILTAGPAAAADPKRSAIVGLTGTTMFAARHCDAFAVNPEKMSTFMKGFGAADENDADVVDLAAALKVEQALERSGDPEATCSGIWLRFGPTGTVGARLFRAK